MPLHMFLTVPERKHIAEQEAIEYELELKDVVVCLIGSDHWKFELSRSIRTRQPDTVWFDGDIDNTVLESWFSVVNDTILAHCPECGMFSYGNKPTNFPEVIYLGKPFPSPTDVPPGKKPKGP